MSLIGNVIRAAIIKEVIGWVIGWLLSLLKKKPKPLADKDMWETGEKKKPYEPPQSLSGS